MATGTSGLEIKPRAERCAICGAPLVQPAGPGRPRQFCGENCQRTAARRRREVRRVAELVERTDPRVDSWMRECGR